MSFMGPAERREFPRIEIQETKVEFVTTYIYATAHVINLSRGGLFIRTPSPLAIGTELRLKFHLPSLPVPLDAAGVVCWTRTDDRASTPRGMGVKLIGLTGEQVAAIDDYLSKCPKTIS